ncbi:MAG: major facilitator superfamily 1 [Gemmatimonadetes bacterium]|nr:major facilitator superfamily 1 [Gemmatimonadota bacterium]
MSVSITLPGVRRGTIPMLALACGVMVGNIYLCQPLLAQMAREFGVPERIASFVAVATQIGYACGILFVVPLGDIARPQVLVRWLMALTALGLFAAAASPVLPMLIVASLVLASTTVVAQVLMPLAPSLTYPQHRGRTIAALSTGLLLGILLSRTMSGAVAEFAGTWRASYIVAGALTTVLFFVVPSFLPAQSPHGNTARYFELLASLPSLLRHRPLLLSMGMNFCVFGAFTALWGTLAFHLATPRFGLGPAAAGLFGLWGAPGAMLAPVAGRLSDRWGSAPVNAIGLMSAALSFVIAGTWGATSVLGLAVAVNFLDFGVQSGQMANQRRIFGIGETIRARLNTLYMVTTFAGGALGALAGGYAWTLAGWRGVCVLGGGLVIVAAIILAVTAFASQASTLPTRRQ